MPHKTQNKCKISAVICELNPLHHGHRAIFDHAREISDGLVCVLSGNFVQRGEPAIIDKWARTRLALANGADLVLELPLPWACAGAERFAAGGVHLAAALGNVTHLVFGSEFDSAEKIKTVATALLSPQFAQVLAELPENGATFAARREQAIAEILGEEYAALLRSPNAVLGIEYTKALLSEGASIEPTVYKRVGASHDQKATAGEFCSASELRELLRSGEAINGLVPPSTEEMILQLAKTGACPADVSHIERAVLARLRTMATADFAALPDISEGLENRLFTAARTAATLEEFYALAKSKRYTHARLRRLAMAAFLGLTADLPQLPPYIRVLGMTKKGGEIIKSATPTLPIVARYADVKKLGGTAEKIFSLEAAADDLYALACPVPQPCGRDFTEKIIKI